MLKRTSSISAKQKEIIYIQHETLLASKKALENQKNLLPKTELHKRMQLTGEIQKIQAKLDDITGIYYSLPENRTSEEKRRKVERSVKGQLPISMFLSDNKENCSRQFPSPTR